MVTKELINEAKTKNNGELAKLIYEQKDNKSIIYILSNIGRLPENFDGRFLLKYLEHSSEMVRFLALKNLGKMCDDNYLDLIYNIAVSDQSSLVRREAVSAIGRMRSLKAVPRLLNLLQDPDPNVLLQVIRALLIFKTNEAVMNALKELQSHPNEIIQSIINKIFPEERLHKTIERNPHTSSPDFLKNLVVQGDVREILNLIPSESVHLTFTSPPYYNARDYSTYSSYQEYLNFIVEVFREVHRITKEGRFFILNTSPIIIPRVSRRHSSKRYPIPFDIHPYLTQMGWEFIDDIIWVKPEASVKNRNSGFAQHRKPLAYKANAVNEYVMVYRKKTDKLIDWNIRQYDYKIIRESKVDNNFNTSNIWDIDPCFDQVHSAVFPLELCKKIVKLYSYKGDLVFDPFAGTGTFGKAVVLLERYFFLTEVELKFVERIKQELSQSIIFDNDFRIINIEEFRNIYRRNYETGK